MLSRERACAHPARTIIGALVRVPEKADTPWPVTRGLDPGLDPRVHPLRKRMGLPGLASRLIIPCFGEKFPGPATSVPGSAKCRDLTASPSNREAIGRPPPPKAPKAAQD